MPLVAVKGARIRILRRDREVSCVGIGQNCLFDSAPGKRSGGAQSGHATGL